MSGVNVNQIKSLKQGQPDSGAKIITLVAQDDYAQWLKYKASAQEKKYCATPGFEGRAGQIQPVYKNDELVSYVAVIGEAWSPHSYSALPKTLPPGEYKVQTGSKTIDRAQLTLGWAMGAYRFDMLKGGKTPVATLHVPPHEGRDESLRLAAAVTRARDLINAPTNMCGVAGLAQHGLSLAHHFNAAAKVTTLKDDKEFPLLWHVGKAGAEAPRMFEMSWGDGAPGNLNLTIIGKGVVYDTGGLALKPRDSMLAMKKDMGGAAHAMALAELVMGANLPVNLRLIVPIVENAINERALRNGDIITSRGGKKTIEIINTDAEGRLILADALDLAGDGVKPDLIIDFATLTAAARTVAEPGTPVVICEDKKLARELEDIGQEIDDRVQPIALDARNAGRVRSTVADLANSGASLPPHIFAAHFLNAFSPKGVARIHIDQGAWGPDGAKDEGLRTSYAFVKRKVLGL